MLGILLGIAFIFVIEIFVGIIAVILAVIVVILIIGIVDIGIVVTFLICLIIGFAVWIDLNIFVGIEIGIIVLIIVWIFCSKCNSYRRKKTFFWNLSKKLMLRQYFRNCYIWQKFINSEYFFEKKCWIL